MSGTCDICGRVTDELFEVKINGYNFMVCSDCKSMGQLVKKVNEGKKEVKPKIIKKEEKDPWEYEDMDESEKLIKNLRKYMSKNKLNTKEISEQLFIKESVLKRILNGEMIAPDDILTKIKKFLKNNPL